MNIFKHTRRIHYYETDGMGVVHHSNHLRIFEEARVAWFHDRGMAEILWAKEELYIPLLESSVKYHKPIFFDDKIETTVQVRGDGRRFTFRYATRILESTLDQRTSLARRPREFPLLCASGQTVHTLLNKDFSIVRKIDPKILKIVEAEPWTETWP